MMSGSGPVMPVRPSKKRFLGKRRFIPLRYRLIFQTSCLLILLLGTLGSIVVTHQSLTIQKQLERRGLAMAQSLGALSKASLATYNYIALEQTANQTEKDDPDVIYVIIHDKEGRIAGYSGRADLQGTLLEDAISLKALSAERTITQVSKWGPEETSVVDVAVPVFIPGSDHRWGTIRVALTLTPVYQQIRQTQLIIAGIGCVALVLGILLSNWAARRITRPLGQLVTATIEVAHGNLSQSIDVETGDEVEILASNFSTMIREILAQKQQLESQLAEIKHLQRYTEKLLTTMSDGLLSVDTRGNVAAINPAARRMLGIPDGVDKGCSASVALEQAPEVFSYVEEVLRDFQSGTQRELQIDLGSQDQIVLANSSLLIDAEGRALEVITNLHDVTQLKRLEVLIRQSERLAALGTLAAGMAHEIRNPLSAIKTFVQLLPRKVNKPEFLEKFQRTVPRELDRINRLIEDLLELSRTPKYRFEALNLQTLLDQSIEFFEGELRIAKIECVTEATPDLPLILADPDQLIKALYNLMRNAIQAMPNGGRLTVERYRETGDSPNKLIPSNQDGWVCLVFSDTGVGIPSEIVKDIFNPFFSTKDRGTGLGLAITHKVITEHGGHLDVVSREGEGSSFTIYLPACRKKSLPTSL
jgi:nitrogen fixation/metabolism regulation signal transduction histidine kinase